MSSTMTPWGRLATSKAMRSSKPSRSTRSLQATVPPGVMVTSGMIPVSILPGPGLVPAEGERCTTTLGLAASLIVPNAAGVFGSLLAADGGGGGDLDGLELLFGGSDGVGGRVDDARGFVEALPE